MPGRVGQQLAQVRRRRTRPPPGAPRGRSSSGVQTRRAGRTPPSPRRPGRRSPGSRRAGAVGAARGSRSAAGRGRTAPTPPVGWNQYMTWRSTVSGTPRSASSSGAHAPGQTTSVARGRTCRPRWSPGRRRRRPSQSSAGSSNRRSAPRCAGQRRGAPTTVASGRTNPASASYSPTSSSAGRHGREPAPDLRGVEQLVRQVPLAGGPQAAGDHLGVRPAELEAAGERQQVGAGVGLELAPRARRRAAAAARRPGPRSRPAG